MRRLPAAATLLLSLAAAAADYEFLPPSPQAGEPFAIVGVLQAGNIDGCPVKTMSAEVVGNEIRVNDYTGPGYAGHSWSCRLGALVPGATPGTYLATLRTASGFLGTAGPVAVAAGAPVAPARRDLTGNWFSRDENGWGLNIVQGDSGKLFIAWMMYRPARQPLPRSASDYSVSNGMVGNSAWLIVPDGRWIAPTTWRGLAYQSRNASFSEPIVASRQQATPVGYVEVSFSGANEASFRGRFINDVLPEPMIEKTAVLHRFDF